MRAPKVTGLLLLCLLALGGLAADAARVAGGHAGGHDPKKKVTLDPQKGHAGQHHTVIDLRGDAAHTSYTPPSQEKDPNFLHAFTSSFAMIMVCELGDETFIIAALMAMRHPRIIVLGGALSALIVMTILSTALGYIVPNIISQTGTHHIATGLYTFFGFRLLYIAWKSDPSETAEEMEEVEAKLESGQPPKGLLRRVAARFLTPIFLESFILTFLAEWGDRSQIATITLAAHKDPYGVTVGAIIGHSICTGLAVVGGRLLALKISQRTVAISGGTLFMIFAIHNAFWGGIGE
mmetsp:Transcript_48823/g.156387  ORF Transcript_48823/g.156387 Transcript_48823/m.156387 type:complete len:293 (-) Transcript_48823:411-1289(-)